MKKIITLFTFLVFTCSFSQVDYDSQIQPIFDVNCVCCHVGAAAYTGGLDLTSYDELMEGGYTDGGVISTGLLEDYVVTGYMPAWGADPLSDEEVELITQWITEGANPSEGLSGCTENGELYCIGCEIWIDECTYFECLEDLIDHSTNGSQVTPVDIFYNRIKISKVFD